MRLFCKIITYITISCGLSYLAYEGNGSFFIEFLKNIIPLLATLLAINMTSSALIAGELSKLRIKYPKADLTATNKEMKKTFIFQLYLLIALFIIFLLRDALIIQNLEIKKIVTLISNAFAIGIFLYYLEIIYDLGKALFDILNFNNQNEDL
ncbi:hypothetical protein NXY11_22430 [Parabacteroides faecis]|uniref:hypothetical protein n=1 Tax=Parabacteroides faecis TaxID=1217282 RepID=UPI002164DF83|nr:hypothetical protein [Parabacteroides faecis]MCS2890432.1 hypothetical protein [Parabacteroides faecis]UVQ45882.1 hypothetical protein NXY11_22430 [Parabacteroides faecis]